MTNIQDQIERNCTSTGKYDRRNTEVIPRNMRNTEVGLHIALANMDGESDRVNTMVKKYRNARIPLETITTIDGLKIAMDTAYDTAENSIFNSSGKWDKIISIEKPAYRFMGSYGDLNRLISNEKPEKPVYKEFLEGIEYLKKKLSDTTK